MKLIINTRLIGLAVILCSILLLLFSVDSIMRMIAGAGIMMGIVAFAVGPEFRIRW